MFFYIDESGQTGNNLFDSAQPFFFYGLLSAPEDLREDAELAKLIDNIRSSLNVRVLHANALTEEQLRFAMRELFDLLRVRDVKFSFFVQNKVDSALLWFAEQFLDSEINSGIDSEVYNTILKYFFILNLFSMEIYEWLPKYWQAFLKSKLMQDCEWRSLFNELEGIIQASSCKDYVKSQLLSGVRFCIQEPQCLLQGFKGKKEKINMAPNIVLFYECLMHMGQFRCNNLSRIYIDEQNQFNKAQVSAHKYYMENMQNRKITIPSLYSSRQHGVIPSKMYVATDSDNIGIEIVDLILSFYVARYKDQNLTDELFQLYEKEIQCFLYFINKEQVERNAKDAYERLTK